MQLPVYVFLIKNSNLFNNVIIGGFYLQKILNNYQSLEDKKKSLKLQGYSNLDINILNEVDSSYEDSNMIKSLKTTKDGFSRYAKVLDNSQIDKLSDIVKENIINASKDILDGKFDINPKEIKNDIVGCKYCPYKDICFMDNSDIITLEEKELFGGEIDEMD
jgi:ATP-dependent helicase/DNAse subunit B